MGSNEVIADDHPLQMHSVQGYHPRQIDHFQTYANRSEEKVDSTYLNDLPQGRDNV